MDDYPRNINELEARFSSEEACRAYMFRLRWPEGFRCPRCGGSKAWPFRSVRLECGDCGHQTSVTAGTIFQDTRKPLVLWFRTMWGVTSQKKGFEGGRRRLKLWWSLPLKKMAPASDASECGGSRTPRPRAGSRLSWRTS